LSLSVASAQGGVGHDGADRNRLRHGLRHGVLQRDPRIKRDSTLTQPVMA
jgi:hypothetical protein